MKTKSLAALDPEERNELVENAISNYNRRDFLKCAGAVGTALAVLDSSELMAASKKTPVALVKTDNRKVGVKTALKTLGINAGQE